MNSVKTSKGTELPLIKVKGGKDYLQVAYRLQWLNDDAEMNKLKFIITTQLLMVDDAQTIAKAVITLMDENGMTLKQATGTKRETKSDFPDHTEKAETGAIGRALATMGYGTQFALSDLDEGTRIVDSPLAKVGGDSPATMPVAAKKASFKGATQTKASEEGWS